MIEGESLRAWLVRRYEMIHQAIFDDDILLGIVNDTNNIVYILLTNEKYTSKLVS